MGCSFAAYISYAQKRGIRLLCRDSASTYEVPCKNGRRRIPTHQPHCAQRLQWISESRPSSPRVQASPCESSAKLRSHPRTSSTDCSVTPSFPPAGILKGTIFDCRLTQRTTVYSFQNALQNHLLLLHGLHSLGHLHALSLRIVLPTDRRRNAVLVRGRCGGRQFY